ncbi:hypothetical protein LTR84_008944 [Exophiala bonariae]|uniref:Uncharacterized protein n=1 Tax=Exophiala bonariae TaxID=1690606 RepID=A0AAV9MYY0_9EURO|nr:hypothetical protein LTR84_008944 [Exophiala bonariae]
MPIPSRVTDASQKFISIAIAEPHAMHSMLAVAACHWRYHLKSYRRRCPSQMFHSMKACAGLRHYLETPQRAKIDVDTAMTTSMFLGSLAFADATEDSEVPLENRPVPFHWLRNQLNFGSLLGYFQSTAKMESICLGIFGEITQETLQLNGNSPGTDGVPREWVILFDVEETSMSKQDRYSSVLCRLCHLLSLNPDNGLALLQYMQFLEGLSSPFVLLLNTLDIRALMLLSYWLALLCAKDCWWSRVRSRIDCWEICKYLEKNGDESLWRYMDFPAVACDYPYTSSSSAGRHLVDRLRQERSQYMDHYDPIRED